MSCGCRSRRGDEDEIGIEKEDRGRITRRIESAALHEVIAGLKIDKMRARKLLRCSCGTSMVKVQKSWFFIAARWKNCAAVGTYKVKSATIDVGKFKELTG